MNKILLALFVMAGSPALAKQSLQAAMVQNPKLSAMVDAIKAASGVDCLTIDSLSRESVRGPQGRTAITQQTACFDPNAFNPTQLGQLEVTYYGDGKQPTSAVGDVIEIKFEVFK